MHRVDQKFATWTQLDERLKDVQFQLIEVAKHPGLIAPELMDESAKLQRECRIALHELNAEYARVKSELR